VPIPSVRVPLVRPTFPTLDTFQEAFAKCLDSGKVTNNGEHVQEFERRLTEYLGAPTIVFSSGTAALMCLLRAIRNETQSARREVIVPSFTFPATINAILWAGATPVFVDIRGDRLTIDPAAVRRAVTEQTLAILGVDAYGLCCDYDVLSEIAWSAGAAIVYDSAPAFGSMWQGKLTGTQGHGQIFSFHATKPFSTMEGGALCSRDPNILAEARRLRNFGLSALNEHVSAGINGKMMEVCAIIGIWNLLAWTHTAAERADVAELLSHRVRMRGLQPIAAPEEQSPIWTYLPVLVDEKKFGLNRDQLHSVLRFHGVETRSYYPACHKSAPVRVEKPLPVTEDVANRVLAFPVLNDMTSEEIFHIHSTLKEIAKSACESSSSAPADTSESLSARH
jgi:dTDP-4-amino-4,6-dideoxygalactose transaminase